MQYASQEELKEDTAVFKPLTELPEFDAMTKAAYQKLLGKVSYKKPDSNSFSTALRFFKVPSLTELKFPTMAYLRQHISRGIQALYIFRLHHPHKSGYTHGMHVRLHGFVPRRIFESLNEELVRSLTSQTLQLRAYVPIYNKNVSLFDYLQSLYVLPANLLVNFSHHLDVLAELQKVHRPDTKEATALRQKVQGMTCQIIENMVSMPSKFTTSYLSTILSMDQEEFRRHLRTTNIQDIVSKVAQDAYSMCLQDKRLKQTEVQEFMEPMTRRSMLNHCVSPKTTKQIQILLHQQYDDYFVHPHPYNKIYRSDLSKLRPLDGLVFEPSFLFTILLVGRWFAKTCMVDEKAISNNQAHLLLYGSSGTGKSLIINSIASAIPTYKFLVESRFQNPDLLQSSLLTMEEMDTTALPSNKYKQLLDIKSDVKIDFKNLNPENCTENVPCMISTNDDIYGKLRACKQYNNASIDAALRRLYVIPVKSGSYDKLHGRVPRESPHWKDLLEFDFKFDEEPSKLSRIFNLIVAFALYQQDVKGIYLDQRVVGYFGKLAREFSYTAFGTFYLCNKQRIDDLIGEVETAMQRPDQDDSSYLIKVCTCHGSFQQLFTDFIAQVSTRTDGINLNILRDKYVPQPAKAYYFLENPKFAVGLMYQTRADYTVYLNPEVAAFLNNQQMQQFVPQDSPNLAYMDLHELSSNEIFEPVLRSFHSSNQDLLDVESVIGSKRSFAEFMGVDDILEQQADNQQEINEINH